MLHYSSTTTTLLLNVFQVPFVKKLLYRCKARWHHTGCFIGILPPPECYQRNLTFSRCPVPYCSPKNENNYSAEKKQIHPFPDARPAPKYNRKDHPYQNKPSSPAYHFRQRVLIEEFNIQRSHLKRYRASYYSLSTPNLAAKTTTLSSSLSLVKN